MAHEVNVRPDTGCEDEGVPKEPTAGDLQLGVCSKDASFAVGVRGTEFLAPEDHECVLELICCPFGVTQGVSVCVPAGQAAI